MGNKLLRFQRVTLVLGAATVTLLCVPCATHAQTSASQDRQGVQRDSENRDNDRRDVANFDRFLMIIVKLPNRFAKIRPC